jgi:hypothetical protein
LIESQIINTLFFVFRVGFNYSTCHFNIKAAINISEELHIAVFQEKLNYKTVVPFVSDFASKSLFIGLRILLEDFLSFLFFGTSGI